MHLLWDFSDILDLSAAVFYIVYFIKHSSARSEAELHEAELWNIVPVFCSVFRGMLEVCLHM